MDKLRSIITRARANRALAMENKKSDGSVGVRTPVIGGSRPIMKGRSFLSFCIIYLNFIF